jgi:hypothetical protein
MTSTAATKFRTADHILHKPAGEKWVVAYADHDAGHLAPMGWPDCEAKISDCEIVKAATDDEYLDAIADLAVSGDRRAKKATQIAAREIGGRV